MTPYCRLLAVLSLLPAVAARTVRIGGRSVGSTFDAPPLQVANVVAYSLFLLGALAQLAIVAPALFRPGVRLPAAGAAVALTILAIGDALSIAIIVTRYVVNDEGLPPISAVGYNSLQAASSLFYGWTNPAILAAVALLLYNRHRTVQKSNSTALIAFASAAGLLLVLMIVFIVAGVVIVNAALTAGLHHAISLLDMDRRLQMANDVFCAYVAFYIIGTLLLAAAAFLVKVRTKADTVASLTLFVVVPLLLLHALARLILTILQARLHFTLNGAYAINFASTFVYGLLHFAAMSMVVFLLARRPLWSDATPHFLPSTGTPHMFNQALPPAQFPGQWGYPQQPHPQHYPHAPVYPAQGPHEGTPVGLTAAYKPLPQPSVQA